MDAAGYSFDELESTDDNLRFLGEGRTLMQMSGWNYRIVHDDVLEAQWRQLPDYVGEDVNALMPVVVSPLPDNIFQVYILFSACDPEIADELTPQEFPTFIREGFAVLEWGGIRID